MSHHVSRRSRCPRAVGWKKSQCSIPGWMDPISIDTGDDIQYVMIRYKQGIKTGMHDSLGEGGQGRHTMPHKECTRLECIKTSSVYQVCMAMHARIGPRRCDDYSGYIHAHNIRTYRTRGMMITFPSHTTPIITYMYNLGTWLSNFRSFPSSTSLPPSFSLSLSLSLSTNLLI